MYNPYNLGKCQVKLTMKCLIPSEHATLFRRTAWTRQTRHSPFESPWHLHKNFSRLCPMPTSVNFAGLFRWHNISFLCLWWFSERFFSGADFVCFRNHCRIHTAARWPSGNNFPELDADLSKTLSFLLKFLWKENVFGDCPTRNHWKHNAGRSSNMKNGPLCRHTCVSVNPKTPVAVSAKSVCVFCMRNPDVHLSHQGKKDTPGSFAWARILTADNQGSRWYFPNSSYRWQMYNSSKTWVVRGLHKKGLCWKWGKYCAHRGRQIDAQFSSAVHLVHTLLDWHLISSVSRTFAFVLSSKARKLYQPTPTSLRWFWLVSQQFLWVLIILMLKTDQQPSACWDNTTQT